MRIFALSIWMILSLSPALLSAQTDPSPVIFIYDASGSMWGKMEGKAKKEIARDVLSKAVNELPSNQKIGLVAYGHRQKKDCEDVELLVPYENGNKSKVVSALKSINSVGMTPLAYSAALVFNNLKKTTHSATIILVTDGIESCDGDICDVVKLAKKDGINFRLHIIGFGLKDEETMQLKCAAKAGDGQYYDADNTSGLAEVLQHATSESIDKPKANVSFFAVKNGIPIDAWVKATSTTSKLATISVRTYKDTATVYFPPGKYKLEVSPLEGSDVNKLSFSPFQSYEDSIVHKSFSFDGGKIGITTTNNGTNWDCMVKVLDQNGKPAASVRTYQTPKEVEVNPGLYKISIQALAMNGMHTYTEIDSILVQAGETNTISQNFETGTAFIDAKGGGKSIDSVLSVEDAKSGTNVAGGRTYNRGKEFLLNPGTYKVKVSPLSDFKDKKPQIVTFEVKKGQKTTKTVTF